MKNQGNNHKEHNLNKKKGKTTREDEEMKFYDVKPL